MPEPMYACTRCGKDLPRDQLSSKKVLFAGIGNATTVFRSRVVDWLCDSCLGKDPDYNYPRDVSRAERMRNAAAAARAREKESRLDQA
ncbi:hypothetical protein SEA_ADGERS_73 [Gordonia phage Adgers]|uniref:DNA binding protein n=3 Tax=Montyvirus TaxID=2733196 RepID=A0A2L1IVM0_9CAUD|nr:hypothetical protein HOS45_gp061 [Gordonia phage BirksAndSocks]YP_009837039.1 hypothetical protein HWB50_gp061 [Gordonia phage Adgers]AUE22224.1 hypothetical protein SEA_BIRKSANDSOCKS_74 [Gordonia phage BirksAndSocks]AVD99203.1 hypothetical protein SEA_ADGERS_73 [Gordonia phage Adgers]QAY16459.1 hypothetical protein SEA_MSAY19_74 [Gordonia phage Msay19]